MPISVAVILAGIVVSAVGSKIYVDQFKHISQLRLKIKNAQVQLQVDKLRNSASSSKMEEKGLKLDGVFQDTNELYAVFNGHLFKTGDRILKKYEVQEVSRYKVSVKNIVNGEILSFTLVNPAVTQKSHK
jgi:hypothetical protein